MTSIKPLCVRLQPLWMGGAVALWAMGCECGSDAPRLTPRPASPPAQETTATATEHHTLAPTTRTDLPAAAPALSAIVDGREVIVTNEALVATWPATDRDRLAAAPPQDAPQGWPSVRATVTLRETNALAVPELSRALSLAGSVERTRSGTGAPGVLALRVTAGTPWQSVMRTLYAANMAGLSEPRFVLMSGRDEVELRAPTRPEAHARDTQALVAALQRALAAQGVEALVVADPPTTPTVSPAPEAHAEAEAHAEVEVHAGAQPGTEAGADARAEAAAPTQVRVMLAREGLVVHRDGVRLGPGCSREAVGPDPSLPTASLLSPVLRASSLRRCLAAAGPSAAPYLFEADGTLDFAHVLPVLEGLHAQGEIAFDHTPQ